MKNILNTIGNTPFLRIEDIYVKLETVNPSGSVKDRMARFMVEQAEKRKEIRPGYTIIEATSGNTGVSLSLVAAVKGYKMRVVIPEKMGREKKKMMRALGARVLTSPPDQGLEGAIRKTRRLARKQKRTWLPRQFENEDNPRVYQLGLAREVMREISRVDAFVAGIGTGGTLMGTARALKNRSSSTMIVGVEAAEEPHRIEGISDGITPRILDPSLIDTVVKVRSETALFQAKRLVDKGILVGPSSGANLWAAKKIKQKHGFKKVVTLLPDRAERYPELW